MKPDPRAALAVLVSALERHLEAAASRRDPDDPTVVAAAQDLAEAFDAYDDALFDTTDVATPLAIYDGPFEDDDDEDDDEEDSDDDLDDLDEDSGIYSGLEDVDLDDGDDGEDDDDSDDDDVDVDVDDDDVDVDDDDVDVDDEDPDDEDPDDEEPADVTR